MNVDIYTLCYNEIKIIPFVIDYWKRFARHVYVYDNGSDDGSIELLESYDWITVRHFEMDKIDENKYLEIKNNCWKGSDADWVVVCDMDEVLWLDDYSILENTEATIIKPHGLQVMKKDFPLYKEGQLLHTMEGIRFSPDEYYFNKCIWFKPNAINEIDYIAGCHFCRPKGNVNYGLVGHLLHFKFIGLDYVLNKYHISAQRLSEENKVKGWGREYLDNDEKIIAKFNKFMDNSRDRI